MLPFAFSYGFRRLDNTIRSGTPNVFGNLVRHVRGDLGQRLSPVPNKRLGSMAPCLRPTVTERGHRHTPSRLPVVYLSDLSDNTFIAAT